MSQSSDEERFLTLETKVAYQEKLIADLHEVLLARGKEIDMLKKRIDVVERIYREDAELDPSHDAPPHY